MKSWIYKRENCKVHQIKTLQKDVAGMIKGSKMLIANTQIIDDFINEIPTGDFIEIKKLRSILAKKFYCDVTCPLTTGIFIRIVSEAAFEEYNTGKDLDQITPFWRVIDPKSRIAKKLECGVDFIENQQNNENISITS
tara:strand:- start:58 stop:471 length:414 start_codon:yes stop_codon:yes gene_type:complete